MVTGIHTLLYSRDPEATRNFFRNVLKLASVDGGGGWPIFALPPAELGIHPADGVTGSELYLMCDDVDRTLNEMQLAGAKMRHPISNRDWGRVTSLEIPGGVTLGLYQPKHPTALAVAIEQAARYRSAPKRSTAKPAAPAKMPRSKPPASKVHRKK